MGVQLNYIYQQTKQLPVGKFLQRRLLCLSVYKNADVKMAAIL